VDRVLARAAKSRTVDPTCISTGLVVVLQCACDLGRAYWRWCMWLLFQGKPFAECCQPAPSPTAIWEIGRAAQATAFSEQQGRGKEFAHRFTQGGGRVRDGISLQALR
jgi:hypothetical protein